MAVSTSHKIKVIEVVLRMSCLEKKEKEKKKTKKNKHTKPKSRETKKYKVLTKTIYETLSQETKKQEVSRNKKKICMAVQKKKKMKQNMAVRTSQ